MRRRRSAVHIGRRRFRITTGCGERRSWGCASPKRLAAPAVPTRACMRAFVQEIDAHGALVERPHPARLEEEMTRTVRPGRLEREQHAAIVEEPKSVLADRGRKRQRHSCSSRARSPAGTATLAWRSKPSRCACRGALETTHGASGFGIETATPEEAPHPRGNRREHAADFFVRRGRRPRCHEGLRRPPGLHALNVVEAVAVRLRPVIKSRARSHHLSESFAGRHWIKSPRERMASAAGTISTPPSCQRREPV